MWEGAPLSPPTVVGAARVECVIKIDRPTRPAQRDAKSGPLDAVRAAPEAT